MKSVPGYAALALIVLSILPLGSSLNVAELWVSTLIIAIAALVFLLPSVRLGIGEYAALSGIIMLTLIHVIQGWMWIGVPHLAGLLAAFCLFVMMRSAALSRSGADRMVQAVLVIGTVFSLISVIDFFLDPTLIFGAIRPPNVTRLSTPFYSSNTAGTFYAVMTVLAAAKLLSVFDRFDRQRRSAFEDLLKRAGLAAACLLVAMSCVFLSGSRAGITALAFGLIILSAWHFLGRRKTPSTSSRLQVNAWTNATAPLLIIVVLGFVFWISGELYAARLDQLLLTGDQARGTLYPILYQASFIQPWLGHGLGSYDLVSSYVAQADTARMQHFQGHAHSVTLQWAIQAGLVGLVGLITMASAVGLRLAMGMRRRTSQRWILRASFIMAAIVIAHGQVDFALEIPGLMFTFAALMGLGVGVASGGSKPVKKDQSIPHMARFGVSGLLFIAAITSFIAARDYLDAEQIAGLNDAQFTERYHDTADRIVGSHVKLVAIGDRALRLDTPDFEIAQIAFSRYLSIEPRDGTVWAKLAYAQYYTGERSAAELTASLERSYERLPYPRGRFAVWRADFVLSPGIALTDSLERAINREAIYLRRPAPFETNS